MEEECANLLIAYKVGKLAIKNRFAGSTMAVSTAMDGGIITEDLVNV